MSITLRMQGAYTFLGGNTVSCGELIDRIQYTAPSSARILCDHPLCSQEIGVNADY